MSEIIYKITTNDDIELLMSSRLEMLREVFKLADDYEYDDDFVECSRKYFLENDHTTILAIDDDKVIGCASMCYIEVMPTPDHPTGKRAHLMNVYTNKNYRRKGIAQKMMDMLLEDAWNRGTTEISLDSTEAGRPLYEHNGFEASKECMVLVRK